MKDLYFIETSGYNMIVSVDEDNNCLYVTDSDMTDFPCILSPYYDKEVLARNFLEKIEHVDGRFDNSTYDELFDICSIIYAHIISSDKFNCTAKAFLTLPSYTVFSILPIFLCNRD